MCEYLTANRDKIKNAREGRLGNILFFLRKHLKKKFGSNEEEGLQ
jgi:hypothetical protein